MRINSQLAWNNHIAHVSFAKVIITSYLAMSQRCAQLNTFVRFINVPIGGAQRIVTPFSIILYQTLLIYSIFSNICKKRRKKKTERSWWKAYSRMRTGRFQLFRSNAANLIKFCPVELPSKIISPFPLYSDKTFHDVIFFSSLLSLSFFEVALAPRYFDVQ